jgi:hypothetical protein
MIALEEIAEGAIDVVTSNLGATEDEIVMRVSRMLGFKATSAQLRSVIISAVSNLVEGSMLKKSDGLLTVNDSPIIPESA